jgi:hypothetical protein
LRHPITLPLSILNLWGGALESAGSAFEDSRALSSVNETSAEQ